MWMMKTVSEEFIFLFTIKKPQRSRHKAEQIICMTWYPQFIGAVNVSLGYQSSQKYQSTRIVLLVYMSDWMLGRLVFSTFWKHFLRLCLGVIKLGWLGIRDVVRRSKCSLGAVLRCLVTVATATRAWLEKLKCKWIILCPHFAVSHVYKSGTGKFFSA